VNGATHGLGSVVVIDDEPTVREVLVALLEASGYDVPGSAENARDGIALATRTQPDVVLMDMRMPGMSGLEATPLLVEACPGTRIILLTGLGHEILGPAATAAGAFACLPKGDAWPSVRATLALALHDVHRRSELSC
jgi:DNA-binding NarL/FixJ family response regulator